MTQTRVFVTYLPARSAPGRAAARPPGSLRTPAVTVLASAIFAGGLVHALGGAGAFTHREPRITYNPAPGPGASAKREAVSFLALAPTEMPPSIGPVLAPPLAPAAETVAAPPRALPGAAAARSTTKTVPLPRPIAGKRLDLSGFLDDQGLARGSAAMVMEQSLDAEEVPAQLAVGGEDALAASGVPPAGAMPLPPSATPPAEAQTFPTVAVDGVDLGAVTMRGDTVHLGSLVGLLELKMQSEEFARLRAAPAADSFVSLDTLRTAGLDVAVESGGERLTLAAR